MFGPYWIRSCLRVVYFVAVRGNFGGLMEKIIRVKDVLVCLFHEPPKSECGHALSVGMGVVLFIAFIAACVFVKP